MTCLRHAAALVALRHQNISRRDPCASIGFSLPGQGAAGRRRGARPPCPAPRGGRAAPTGTRPQSPGSSSASRTAAGAAAPASARRRRARSGAPAPSAPPRAPPHPRSAAPPAHRRALSVHALGRIGVKFSASCVAAGAAAHTAHAHCAQRMLRSSSCTVQSAVRQMPARRACSCAAATERSACSGHGWNQSITVLVARPAKLRQRARSGSPTGDMASTTCRLSRQRAA